MTHSTVIDCMASAVCQDVSPNEVKVRFLPLFNDILVIATFWWRGLTTINDSKACCMFNNGTLQCRSPDVTQNRMKISWAHLHQGLWFCDDSGRCNFSLCRADWTRNRGPHCCLLFKITGLDAAALTTYFCRDPIRRFFKHTRSFRF